MSRPRHKAPRPPREWAAEARIIPPFLGDLPGPIVLHPNAYRRLERLCAIRHGVLDVDRYVELEREYLEALERGDTRASR